ncbi:cap-specific mRNA (nucleoside-2'-O-)-methyltransferase 1 [Copidosoma floridanum]|uniref:cap-specific mRNA (nucleoside-2'-O-)-methyltransferase 1 n=1 Tax=Copidosoma floridanum TaxID=29053 RepID=UPI0006C9533E|nr:cap-specific mRNA (nucleoside-2'-O-)-methyltransferase 1 [Copidosoma floridanum]
MASERLTDTTDSSSGEEAMSPILTGSKRSHFSFDESLERCSKSSRRDSSYTESHDSKESEDDTKDDHCFEKPNFYDDSYRSEKSDDEADKQTHSSYYHDSSLSDQTDEFSKSQTDAESTKKNVNTPGANSQSEARNKIQLMMQKMGYEAGKGLGKSLQGRVQPVEASSQKGRRGLGLELKELQRAEIEFDPEKEVVEVVEKIIWLENTHEELPLDEEVTEWENERLVGKCKDTIDNETMFCDEFIVREVVNSKSVFDRLDNREMQEARTRSNPFETIRGAMFQNRAAVKMANIDKACNLMFTNPLNLQPDELLYFADVCAGPGGFSEYVLWRKKWRAKGFGFTLKSENDFKLHEFQAGPCETFHPYYGVDDTGDVYQPKNQIALRDLIMSQTNERGVHFMMADGGFSVEGQENIQEILSKQLYLCQCLVALMIVRTGGHFVTKVFDLFTPFSAGLVYILYRCFNQISIFKPNTSRPANSERYLICQGKRPNIDFITNYLFRANEKLLKGNKNNDILELVPSQKLFEDERFFNYLKESNEELGRRQIVGLKKIAHYTEHKDLFESRQKMFREKCLKYWEVPDESRSLPSRMAPSTKVQHLLRGSSSILEKMAYKDATKLKKENVNTIITNQLDWCCVPCSSGDNVTSMYEDVAPTMYLGMGRSQVFKYTNGQWKPLNDILIDLPRDTLVYAELVSELRSEERSQIKTYGLHIIDAFQLGSENISQKHITERWKLINLFCKSLWKPTSNPFSPVRAKDWFYLSPSLGEKLKLEAKTMKNKSKVLGYFPIRHLHENDSNQPYYWIPRNLIFFKTLEEPWARHFSNKNHSYYFYNIKKQKSFWERELPDEAKASFAKVIGTRVVWNWPEDKSLSMNEFVNIISKKNENPK